MVGGLKTDAEIRPEEEEEKRMDDGAASRWIQGDVEAWSPQRLCLKKLLLVFLDLKHSSLLTCRS